jgi:polyhydroxybutyrate depolymerase
VRRITAGIVGGLFFASATLGGCAHAHAATPRTEQVASTMRAPRTCGEQVAAGTTTVPVPVGPVTRQVRLYVPHAYRPDRHIPLVLNLHGTGSTAAHQETATGMDATAEARGFLVAYPEGMHHSGSGYGWNIPGTPTYAPRGPDDIGYLGRVITVLHERYCADPDRTYAVGFSGGARMVSQFACAPGRPLVAMAAVGGLRAPATCPSAPVPVLAVHGTADQQNPYLGHGQPYWTYSVPEAARRWGGADGCAIAPSVDRTVPGVTRTTYHDCRAGTTVVLYALTGRGHIWPTPARTGFDTDGTVWQFFAAHAHRTAGRTPNPE